MKMIAGTATNVCAPAWASSHNRIRHHWLQDLRGEVLNGHVDAVQVEAGNRRRRAGLADRDQGVRRNRAGDGRTELALRRLQRREDVVRVEEDRRAGIVAVDAFSGILVLKALIHYLGFFGAFVIVTLGLEFLCSLDYELLAVGIKYFSILNFYPLT